MKQLIPILGLALLAACGAKENTESTGMSNIDFSYELDTVMVDAGDDFIYLNWLLTSSGESQDGKYLYNFNREAISLEYIDLENLVLEKVIPHEKEGPNGIGYGMISRVHETSDKNLIFSDNYQISIFDPEGEKIDGFRYVDQDFEGDRLPEDKRIDLNETFSDDGKTLLALYIGQQMNDSPDGLAIFDLANKRVSYKPLDLLKELDKYKTTLYIDGHTASGSFAPIHLFLKGDTLVYSNSAKNQIYFIDLKTDSITNTKFSSQYTSQEASGNYPKRAESEKEFFEISTEKSKEVNYGKLFFDTRNDVYWRFAKEMDRMKGDTIHYKTVLTAFDKAFNQIHEELLPADFVLPYKYFAREGMIYTFLNIEDELAFVRLKPNFEND